MFTLKISFLNKRFQRSDDDVPSERHLGDVLPPEVPQPPSPPRGALPTPRRPSGHTRQDREGRAADTGEEGGAKMEGRGNMMKMEAAAALSPFLPFLWTHNDPTHMHIISE